MGQQFPGQTKSVGWIWPAAHGCWSWLFPAHESELQASFLHSVRCDLASAIVGVLTPPKLATVQTSAYPSLPSFTKDIYFIFHWGIVALQYCVSFCCTTQWISCVCVCVCVYPLLLEPLSFSPPHFPSLHVITEHQAELPMLYSVSSFPAAIYLYKALLKPLHHCMPSAIWDLCITHYGPVAYLF